MSISMEELIVRCQNGDQSAKEALVVENAGLVWSIAKRYFGRGVDPDDLVAGNESGKSGRGVLVWSGNVGVSVALHDVAADSSVFTGSH